MHKPISVPGECFKTCESMITSHHIFPREGALAKKQHKKCCDKTGIW